MWRNTSKEFKTMQSKNWLCTTCLLSMLPFTDASNQDYSFESDQNSVVEGEYANNPIQSFVDSPKY